MVLIKTLRNSFSLSGVNKMTDLVLLIFLTVQRPFIFLILLTWCIFVLSVLNIINSHCDLTCGASCSNKRKFASPPFLSSVREVNP